MGSILDPVADKMTVLIFTSSLMITGHIPCIHTLLSCRVLILYSRLSKFVDNRKGFTNARIGPNLAI
jgi:phosphatidylglycerophosphate synthase